jgi:outer membrane protein insertion porin family
LRGFSLALALALAGGASLAAAPRALAADRARVALLPIVVHSNDNREYLQQGLSDMLVSRLGRDTRLGVIKVEDPAKATTEIAPARAAGQAEAADYVIYGSFTRFGEGASLDLACAKVSGEGAPRQIFAHADSLGGIIPMLDGVADKATTYVLEGAPAGPSVAAGPAGAAGADSDVQELKRRVEALEHIVFSNTAVPSTKPAEKPADDNKTSLKRTFPGDRP